MKKQKSKPAAPAKRPVAKPQTVKVQKKGLVLRCDHRTEHFDLWPRPSELELATLAARLARTEQIDPKQLVKEAWELYWASCEKIKADHLEVERHLREMEAQEAEEAEEESENIPRPLKYPVTFQEMELLLLPKLKGRTAERAELFREYIFADMVGLSRNDGSGEPRTCYWDYRMKDLDELRDRAQDEVAKAFGSWRRRVYDAQAYFQFASSFLHWHRGWTDLKNSEAKAANAKLGWEKRRKAKTAKTGARPKVGLLKEILEKPPKGA